ncbi:MAG: hypothetical protein AABX73_02845 [Nanoarchaeota archaeon]
MKKKDLVSIILAFGIGFSVHLLYDYIKINNYYQTYESDNSNKSFGENKIYLSN